MSEARRKSPEELLYETERDEVLGKNGYLKIFLGYASGVGKSFRMFDEARRRQARGQDVVVGALQPEIPPEVRALLQRLEVFPLMEVGEGTAVDVEALLRRHPAICLIDGLAYSNPLGARNPTRWEDVQELRNAGIKIVASINIQYIAELRDQVIAITNKQVKETVPVSFIQTADEIEIVDAPSEVSTDRTFEEQLNAREQEHKLSRLRELALLLAADVVDHQLLKYLNDHGIHQNFGAHERLLVCVTPRANINDMLETAIVIAERFHAELIVAYVDQPDLSPEDQALLKEKMAVAQGKGARLEILEGENPVDAILAFSKSKGITQLFIGHSQRSGMKNRLFGNPVDRLIERSRGMDIRIFPQ